MSNIKIIYPYNRVNFGRYVVGERTFERRRLFVESFNAAFKFVKEKFPKFDFADEFCSDQGLGKVLDNTQKSVGYLLDHQELLPEHVKLHIFKNRGALDDFIRLMNLACWHLKTEGKHIEFALGDSPGCPASVIQVKLRKETPFILGEDPDKIVRQLRHLNIGSRLFSKTRIYSESEIHQIFARVYGEVSLYSIREALRQDTDSFSPVLRPSRFDQQEKLYVYCNFKNYAAKTVPVTVAKSGPPAVAIESEVKELVREKRLVMVYCGGRRGFSYFTPDALVYWIEHHGVYETDREGEYIDHKMAYRYPLARAKKHQRSIPSAARAYLDYFYDKKMTEMNRKEYPFLAAAIEALRASPAGSGAYFDAARTAAIHGLGEDAISALLMAKDYPENSRYFYLDREKYYRYEDFLFETLAEQGITLDECERKADKIMAQISLLREIDKISSGAGPIVKSWDFMRLLMKFMRALKRADELKTMYFGLTLGKLAHLPVGRLSGEEERRLRTLVIPMAEKYGYNDLAARMRNEVFRISYNAEFLKTMGQIEEVVGMNYEEMKAHIEYTGDIIHQIMREAGIDKKDYKISLRAKLPFSCWEKMQTLKVNSPGLLKDLLGLSIMVKDDRLVYKVVSLIQQAFLELSEDNFKDRYGLLNFMRGNNFPIYHDQIIKPRKSGFSAITLFRLTELSLPIEIQVTSFERDQVNHSGKAAHWKHKLRRELEHFYGI